MFRGKLRERVARYAKEADNRQLEKCAGKRVARRKRDDERDEIQQRYVPLRSTVMASFSANRHVTQDRGNLSEFKGV